MSDQPTIVHCSWDAAPFEDDDVAVLCDDIVPGFLRVVRLTAGNGPDEAAIEQLILASEIAASHDTALCYAVEKARALGIATVCVATAESLDDDWQQPMFCSLPTD